MMQHLPPKSILLLSVPFLIALSAASVQLAFAGYGKSFNMCRLASICSMRFCSIVLANDSWLMISAS